MNGKVIIENNNRKNENIHTATNCKVIKAIIMATIQGVNSIVILMKLYNKNFFKVKGIGLLLNYLNNHLLVNNAAPIPNEAEIEEFPI